MGMFDYVRAIGPEFQCSEGHLLENSNFQTKDLDPDSGSLSLFTIHTGVGVIEPLPDHGVLPATIEIYTDCHRCPAFVQAGTHNLCAREARFEITLGAGGRILAIRRTSDDLETWLADAKKWVWLRDAHGPMPYEEARQMHINADDCPCVAWQKKLPRPLR